MTDMTTDLTPEPAATWDYAVTYDAQIPPGGGRLHQPARNREQAERMHGIEARRGGNPQILRRPVGLWEPAPADDTAPAVLPSDVGALAATVARAVCDEFDRRHTARVADLEAQLADIDEQLDTDGLDDQDGPVTRAELYIEREGDRAIWAHRDGTWWYADPDIDDTGTAGWWQQRTGPLPATLRRLPGWVEIPQPAEPAPAASEEQTSA